MDQFFFNRLSFFFNNLSSSSSTTSSSSTGSSSSTTSSSSSTGSSSSPSSSSTSSSSSSSSSRCSCRSGCLSYHWFIHHWFNDKIHTCRTAAGLGTTGIGGAVLMEATVTVWNGWVSITEPARLATVTKPSPPS